MTLDAARIDWSATGTMAAAIIALAALALSIWSLIIANRSANAAGRSADAAADSAKDSRRLADTEGHRRHDELDPSPTATFETDLSTRDDGYDVWMVLRVERTCQVHCEGIDDGGGRHVMQVPLLVDANVPARIFVEHMPKGVPTPATRYVHVRAWPPADVDGAQPWSCPCPLPDFDAGQPDRAHWDSKLGVSITKWPPAAFLR